MDLLTSLIQDLENGKQSAHQMRSLIQQVQGSDGVGQLDHDHEYYFKGFHDHSMVVLSTFDNALSKLQRCHLFNSVTTKVEYNDNHSTLIGCKVKDDGLTTPKSSTPKDRRGCNKRRKIGQSDTVIITRNLTDDGYAWRKYGQKDILNEKYPRNYYRCTHKYEQGCQATKQVQQMSHKPDEYRVIYQGEHTCKTLVTRTPLIIPDDHDHQHSSYILSFDNPTPPKHAFNPLIFASSPSPPPSSAPSPMSSLSSSSSSPFATVKHEYYVPVKDGNQSSDLTYTSTTTAFDQGDVISPSIDDVQGLYSSGVAYHGMDNESCSNVADDDFTVFDDVMMQDILCV